MGIRGPLGKILANRLEQRSKTSRSRGGNKSLRVNEQWNDEMFDPNVLSQTLDGRSTQKDRPCESERRLPENTNRETADAQGRRSNVVLAVPTLGKVVDFLTRGSTI